MPTSLSILLSSSPSLPPLPTEKQLPFLPPPSTLSWKISKTTNYVFPAITINTPILPPPLEPTAINNEGRGVLRSCFPSLAWVNVFYFKAGNYNVQVVVGEDEPEDVLLRRFRREVMKAGVIQECKRRRFFENAQAKKKRKAREAARRNRRRPYQPRTPPNEQAASKKKKEEQEEEEDNWELPEGELPY